VWVFMNGVPINRKELYDLVWAIPITSLSKRFGTTDNKIRTICKKMNIPLPRTGHWQRIQYNKQVEIPDLPPEDSKTIKSTIDLIFIKEKKVDRLSEIIEDVEINCKQYLKVKRKVIDPDNVTIEVKKDLERSTPSHFGREKGYLSTYRYPIRFFVTPKNATRALCILDAFVKLVRARYHKIELNGWTYEIIIGDERYEFGIREKQIKIKGTDRYYQYDYKATGILVLSTGRFTNKREYSDGKQSLEKQLSAIVAHLEYQTELWKAELEKHRAHQAIIDEANRKKQANIKRKETEKSNLKDLLKKSKRWHRSIILREYIKLFEANCIKSNTMSNETAEWIAWARAKADWLDPFVNGPDEYLSEDDLLSF